MSTDNSFGTSAWAKTHGSEFAGKRIPFGAKVTYLPLRPFPDKWSPPSRVGVFVGYDITAGYGFRGHYLVWDLEDVAQIDLSANAEGATMRIRSPMKTLVCNLFDEKVVFPRKERYDHLNTTLEGLDEIGRLGVTGGRVRATPRVLANAFVPNDQLFADGTIVVNPGDEQVRVAQGEELVQVGSGAASSHSCDPNAPPAQSMWEVCLAASRSHFTTTHGVRCRCCA